MNSPSPETAVTFEDSMIKLSQQLTFCKIFLILFLLTALVVGSVLYKTAIRADESLNRPVSSDAQRINISAKSKAQLTKIALTSNMIKLIMITEIDAKNNQRFTRWLFIDDALSEKIRASDKLQLPMPIFNTNQKNTQQMIGVLNNEFVCTPFSDTIHYARISVLSPPLVSMCQLAIPLPQFGMFAGILSIGLTSIPTKDQQDALKLEASRIAVTLFLRGDIAL